ncbi:MAG: coproporphyrinogen-III oxidase family protein, partial [Bacillota bacterium]
RLSIGVQSFNNRILKKLGRIHSVEDAVNSYYLARKIGFDNLSFDLMFALPGQSMENWTNTLEQAVKLGPEHLSTYNLKIESGTTFSKWLKEGKLEPVDQDLDLEMYRKSINFLSTNNYQQYEISNFSKASYTSQHNKIYWKNEPYLALGPGAHFYDGDYRGYNVININEYCSRLENPELPYAKSHKLSRVEKIEETMILGLRLNQGVDLDSFVNIFNESIFDIYQSEIEKLIDNSLIKIEHNHLVLTPQGRELANQVLSSFILS